MSDLAEVALAARRSDGDDLIVVGMGKLGGRELNVSSDIDLVFLYAGAADAQERHERAGRRLIRLLSETTEDGFVFRVDMRLRPYGDSGPLACNFEALENYLIAQGREWERYAWIKARALTRREPRARSTPSCARSCSASTWTTPRSPRCARLHAEVRREVARRELAEHVKLGPGGIREIEFIVQALQLIRGGRDAELRVRPTLQALEVLAQRNLLPGAATEELAEAYVFLRNVEHRLQYLDDAQRHDLPEDDEDRARSRRCAGLPRGPSSIRQLEGDRAAVSRHFDDVFAEAEAAARALARASAPRRAAREPALRRAAAGVAPAPRPAGAGARARRAATPEPDATLARGVDLVEAIASRAAYLALLAEHPEALERVARIIGASSWAAEFVTRHPLLLDELLDDRLLYAPMDLLSFQEESPCPARRRATATPSGT